MAFCTDFIQAIATADDIHKQVFLEDTRNTIYLAFVLMHTQSAWLTLKGVDRTWAVFYSMIPGGAAISAYWNGKYQADTQTSEIFTQQQQSMVAANQTQIDGDNDARKDNMSLADGLAGMYATVNGLICSAGAA